MRWRMVAGAAGLVAIAYGIRGVLTGGVATDWPATTVWLRAGGLLHELVFVPVVAVAGWLVTRALPAPVRPVVRGGLVVAGVLVLVALPLVAGVGDDGNPSSTPLDYPRNLALVLLAVAAVTTVLAVARWRRLSRGRGGG